MVGLCNQGVHKTAMHAPVDHTNRGDSSCKLAALCKLWFDVPNWALPNTAWAGVIEKADKLPLVAY